MPEVYQELQRKKVEQERLGSKDPAQVVIHTYDLNATFSTLSIATSTCAAESLCFNKL